MILTCPECQTQYKLATQMLGEAGRTVVCTTCRHTWFQAHVQDKSVQAADLPPEPDLPSPPVEQNFEVLLQQMTVTPPPDLQIPEAVRPGGADFRIPPPPVYKPMGMGAGQFGLLTFLACGFLSLSALFLMRGPIVQLWPPALIVYQTLGFEIKAPGEGLRLGTMTAENRIDKSGRMLAVEAKVSNISQHEAPLPSLRARLTSSYGALLKEWVFPAKPGKPLASGESAPVKLELQDAPEGGSDVELKVIKK
jgi:predicted Zn finger-like uncharacterized protein